MLKLRYKIQLIYPVSPFESSCSYSQIGCSPVEPNIIRKQSFNVQIESFNRAVFATVDILINHGEINRLCHLRVIVCILFLGG